MPGFSHTGQQPPQDGSYGYVDFNLNQTDMGVYNSGEDWSGGSLNPAPYQNPFAMDPPSAYVDWDMTGLDLGNPQPYGPLDHSGPAGFGFQEPQVQPQIGFQGAYEIASPSVTETTANSLDDDSRVTPTPSPSSKPLGGSGRSRQTPKRRKFKPEDKEKVAEVRAMGCCLNCKVLRSTCDTGLPCARCTKIFGNNPFDQHQLCWRQSLTSTRFNTTDLLRVNLYNHCKEQVKDSTKYRFVGVSSPTCCGRQGLIDPVFSLGIHNHRPERPSCWFKNRVTIPLPDTLALNDVPALEVFYQDIPVSSHRGLTGPFGSIHRAVGEFAAMCKRSNCVDFADDLLDKCLDLNRALDTYHKASDGLLSSHASAFDIKHLSAVKAESLELAILRALEKRVFNTQGSRKFDLANPLSTWLCIWILLLNYQAHTHLTKYFNSKNNKVNGLHELAKHLYNAVTMIYAAYFRSQNPLSYDWNTAQVKKELGNDEKLLHCFQNIKTEIMTFYMEEDQLSEHDILFKTLVVEQDKKFLAAQASACAWISADDIF